MDYNQNIGTVTGEAKYGEVEDHPVWIDSTSISEPTPDKKPLYYRNRPNPASEMVEIRYSLTAPDWVDLAIYRATGERIKTLVNILKNLWRTVFFIGMYATSPEQR